MKALAYSDPSSGTRLSEENKPIGRRLGDPGWDKGEGGLEGSADIVAHGQCGRESRGQREVARQSETKTRSDCGRGRGRV